MVVKQVNSSVKTHHTVCLKCSHCVFTAHKITKTEQARKKKRNRDIFNKRNALTKCIWGFTVGPPTVSYSRDLSQTEALIQECSGQLQFASQELIPFGSTSGPANAPYPYLQARLSHALTGPCSSPTLLPTPPPTSGTLLLSRAKIAFSAPSLSCASPTVFLPSQLVGLSCPRLSTRPGCSLSGGFPRPLYPPPRPASPSLLTWPTQPRQPPPPQPPPLPPRALTFFAAARTPLSSPPPLASASRPGCCACSPCARRCRCGRAGTRRAPGPARAGTRPCWWSASGTATPAAGSVYSPATWSVSARAPCPGTATATGSASCCVCCSSCVWSGTSSGSETGPSFRATL